MCMVHKSDVQITCTRYRLFEMQNVIPCHVMSCHVCVCCVCVCVSECVWCVCVFEINKYIVTRSMFSVNMQSVHVLFGRG